MPDKKEAPPEPQGPGQPIPEYKVNNPMEKKPVVAPDGHIVLSQEDIDARN